MEGSGRKLVCGEGKQARACTPKGHEESALRSMVMMSFSRIPGKMPSGDTEVHGKVEIKTPMIGRSRRSEQAVPDPQQNIRCSSRGLWMQAA